jgi:hypothetical protein
VNEIVREGKTNGAKGYQELGPGAVRLQVMFGDELDLSGGKKEAATAILERAANEIKEVLGLTGSPVREG